MQAPTSGLAELPGVGSGTHVGAQAPVRGSATGPGQQLWFLGKQPRGGRLSVGVPSATLPGLIALQVCKALAWCEARVCSMRAADVMGSSGTVAGLKMPSPVTLPVLAGDTG